MQIQSWKFELETDEDTVCQVSFRSFSAERWCSWLAFQAGQGQVWGLRGGPGRSRNQFKMKFLGLEIPLSFVFLEIVSVLCLFLCFCLSSEFGNSCFFLVLSFMLFLAPLCARNCATFRKFSCFFASFKFVFCATLCSELCDFSEILVFLSSFQGLWFFLAGAAFKTVKNRTR